MVHEFLWHDDDNLDRNCDRNRKENCPSSRMGTAMESGWCIYTGQTSITIDSNKPIIVLISVSEILMKTVRLFHG